MSLANLLLFLAAAASPAETDFRLANGLRVIFRAEPDLPVTVVALGVFAGVHDEPEGRSGLAHLAEHLFCYAGAAKHKAGEGYARLGESGPTGRPFADANAETMWRLTYYYSARKPGDEGPALAVFADHLAGVTVTPEVLNRERGRVLAEVASVAAATERNPALLAQLRAFYRRPKAGTAADVEALTAADVQGFLDTHYRPERAVLLVRGRFDPAAARAKVEELFGPVRGRKLTPPTAGKPAPAGPLLVATYPAADPARLPAVRVAAAAWEAALAGKERSYVEVAPGGGVRAVLPGADGDRLTATRDALHRPLADAAFRAARDKAGEMARQTKQMNETVAGWPVPKEPAKAAPVVAQGCINRLLFEAEGGQELLDRLAAVTADQVAESARKHLTAAAEDRRQYRP